MFIDPFGCAIRISSALDIRELACSYVRDEARLYSAQMQAYQSMPNEEILAVQDVVLNNPIEQIVSQPDMRVNCDVCGEEIMNEREVHQNEMTLCQPCAYGGYYRVGQNAILSYTLHTLW